MKEDTARKHQMFARGQTSDVGFSPASLLTRAELLDHARHPRNRGELQGADIVQEESNPLCGDVVKVFTVMGEVMGSRQWAVNRTTFTGGGCLISQAAASMLSEHVVGKSLAEVERMVRADMEAMLGGAVSPSRVKCAMLPLIALKKGIASWRGGERQRSNLQQAKESA